MGLTARVEKQFFPQIYAEKCLQMSADSTLKSACICEFFLRKSAGKQPDQPITNSRLSHIFSAAKSRSASVCAADTKPTS